MMPAHQWPTGATLTASRRLPDLLDCRDIVIATSEFRAMDACRSFVHWFWAHAAIVGKPPDGRFLLRCRYHPALARAGQE